MDDDLVRELSNIENEIIGLKTTQKSQNDSYTLYSYTTGNVAFEATDTVGSKEYTVTFIPSHHQQDKVLCQFFVFDASQVSMRFWGSVNVNSPLVCKFIAFGYNSYVPVWQRKVYALCVANCEGELRIEYTEGL